MIEIAGGLSAYSALKRDGLVAGLGLRAQANMHDLLLLLDHCLARLGAGRGDLLALATLDAKAGHPALLAAAGRLDLPIVALSRPDLVADVPNPSLRVAAHAGIASVAEAAALAFGPLLLEKQRDPMCTCALSRYVAAEAAGRSSALSAASTLATSSAGP